MTQGSVVLPTTGTVSGLTMTQDTNAALAALATLQAGASAPSTGTTGLAANAGIQWHDTTNALIKIRDQADSAWMVQGAIDETNKIWMPPIGGGINNIASAATTNLGSLNQSLLNITGSTTISSFGTSMVTGTMKTVVLAAALTITYNATSMILPGAQDYYGSAGDVLDVYCIASGNYIVTVSPSKSIQASPAIGTYRNLAVFPNTLTTAGVSVDEIVLGVALGGAMYKVNSVSVGLNFATTGAGALDTGTVAANALYYIYLIYNPTSNTVAALATTSGAGSTIYAGTHMPTGYKASVLVSAFYTNGSSQLNNFRQQGGVMYLSSPVQAVTNGTATSYSVVTPSIPPSAICFSGYFSLNNTNSEITIAGNANGVGITSVNSNNAPSAIPYANAVLMSGSFYYSVNSGTSASVWISSYTLF